jgi:glycosyltransferase involved in cell wall biosynthesis
MLGVKLIIPKVTHIVRLFESYGIGNHLLTLLPGLVEAGLDVELIAITAQTPNPMVMDVLKKLEDSGVHVTIQPFRIKPPFQLFWFLPIERTLDLFKLFRKRKNRIVHFHLEFFGIPTAIWMSGCKKVVMSIHSDDKWFSSPIVRVWLHIIDRFVGRYIAVSERTKAYYAATANIDPQKIERIYHGINYVHEQTTESIRKQYNMPSNRFIFGIVGRLTYAKNIELLIEAAQRLPEAHCVIVGDGELRDSLHQQANGLSNVQLMGYHPNGYEFMSGFDLFCLPSRFEGLGLVLIEAMLQGVPILGSRAGAIPEILKDGEYGLLFDSGDLNGLVSSIQYAMNNKNIISYTASRAKQYAQDTFSVKKMVDQTIQVYNAVEKSRA